MSDRDIANIKNELEILTTVVKEIKDLLQDKLAPPKPSDDTHEHDWKLGIGDIVWCDCGEETTWKRLEKLILSE